MLEQALKEARFSIEGIRRDFGDADIQTRNADSGGGKLEVQLTAGEQRGDIFVSGNKTLGVVDHGHTGIYVSTEHIVEAPGLGENSHNVLARSIKVTNDAVKQRVNTSEENRNKAADYARDHMVDKPYNVHFEDNKHVPADSYNCSQLVWGAYMAGADVDLDSNGGRAVFPYDLKDSELTETYEVLKK